MKNNFLEFEGDLINLNILFLVSFENENENDERKIVFHFYEFSREYFYEDKEEFINLRKYIKKMIYNNNFLTLG